MKKTVMLVMIVFIAALSFAFMRADKKPRYENLKVLPKNTEKQQMDSIMRHFSQSLGVRCNFCHVRNDDEKKDFNFPSDDNKHKLMARDMMKMTAKLNKKYFDEDEHGQKNLIAQVTCFTCHNGKEHPAIAPPPPPARN